MESDALKIVKQTQKELEVWDPPNYSSARYMFFLSAFFVVVTALLHFKLNDFTIIGLLFSAVVGFLGVYLWKFHITMRFSKDAGTVEIAYKGLVQPRIEKYNLSEVKEILLTDTVKKGHQLTLVLKSGETRWLGYISRRDGYSVVTNAMNEFIKIV